MRRSDPRLPWADVPAHVRHFVDDALGARVVEHRNADGGFTPGPAGTATLTDGREVFVKACGDELSPEVAAMHRTEADVLRKLGADLPAPRLLIEVDRQGWIVLVVELLDGVTPTPPLANSDVDAILELVDQLATLPTDGWSADLPSISQRLQVGRRWADTVEQGDVDRLPAWPRRHLDQLLELERSGDAAAVGSGLVHLDLRSDNVVIGPQGAVAVDWSDACIGAPWVDLVGLLPSIELDGGPTPEELFEQQPVGADAEPEAVNAFLAGVAGYFVTSSLRPPLPTARGLREFQRAQGDIACRWLSSRLSS